MTLATLPCHNDRMLDASAIRTLLTDFSTGRVTAHEARRCLGGATYGDLLKLVAQQGLSLPRSPELGREADLARARDWMFPKNAL